MPCDTPGSVVFDLGGVLIDWDPRYLYRKLFEETGGSQSAAVGGKPTSCEKAA